MVKTSVWNRRVVYVSAAAYACLFAAAALASYRFYLEPRFDLGNVVQAVWSSSHGHLLQVSDVQGHELSRLAGHVDPFLVLLVPLWWIWSSPTLLLIAQALAVASGALPVYWLARKHLGDGSLSAVFALAYLLYPCTQFNAFTPVGMHAVSFAIPLILFAVWFLDEGRLVTFALFALLAAATKEEVAAAVAGLGIWYALRRDRRLAGAVIAAVGLTISALNVLVVIPHYAPRGFTPFAARYAEVGGTPVSILRQAFTDPGTVVHVAVTWHKLLFLVLIFVPFLGLWALEPIMLAGAIPDLVINLLSAKPEQTTIFYQYTAGIIPFVVAASVLGAARLKRRRFAGPALLAVISCLAVVSPIVYIVGRVHSTTRAEIAATRDALKLIPPGVPVSASQTTGAYVSARRSVAVFPSIGAARWVIVGRPAASFDDPATFRSAVARLRKSPQWRTVYDSGGVTVFERLRVASE